MSLISAATLVTQGVCQLPFHFDLTSVTWVLFQTILSGRALGNAEHVGPCHRAHSSEITVSECALHISHSQEPLPCISPEVPTWFFTKHILQTSTNNNLQDLFQLSNVLYVSKLHTASLTMSVLNLSF